MRAWIRAVGVAVVSSGMLACGAGVQREAQWSPGGSDPYAQPAEAFEAQPAAQELAAPTTDPHLTRSAMPVGSGTVALAPQNGWTVVAKGIPAADGQSVQVISGIMGCGWMETGRGQAVAQDGAFTTTLVRSSKDMGYESMYLFVDADGDGTCSAEKGDTVYSVPLSLQGSTVMIDATGAQPTNGWECMVFNRP